MVSSGSGMQTRTTEYRIRGRSYTVPSQIVRGRELISVGRWPRMAMFRDEDWLEGELVPDPAAFVAELRASGLAADIFAFSGPLEGGPPHAGLHYELDNAAVIHTSYYKAWWEGLPQEARKNTRRAAKKGISVRIVPFDDELVAGIKSIYDEAPVRQGRPFWHYGKDIARVRLENSSYLDRCDFIGAYFGDQLVGFVKLVYVDNAARMMQILCLSAHQDKRPIIALIAHAAQHCHRKGIRYLHYGKFSYYGKIDSSMAEFKRRLGFERIEYPRYFIPLTIGGRIALKAGVHKGWRTLLPQNAVEQAQRIRTVWLARRIDG